MAIGKKTGGGSRLGSPNKSTAEIKELLDREVDFGVVISKLYELSQGVESEKFSMGDSIIYQEKPDAYAAKILLEYRYGKPVQTVNQNTTVTSPQKFKIGDQEISFD